MVEPPGRTVPELLGICQVATPSLKWMLFRKEKNNNKPNNWLTFLKNAELGAELSSFRVSGL